VEGEEVIIVGREKHKNARPELGLSRPMRAAPHIHFTKHERRGTFTVSAIYPTNDFALVRATGVIGTYLELQSNQTARLPAIPFISMRLPRADAGALSRFLLPAARLRRNICRLLTGWSFPLRIQPAKQSRCGFSDRLNLSCALFHDRNLAWESKHEVHRKSASGAQSSE
jgi:hypothetical protein